jgi:hypothetical protein
MDPFDHLAVPTPRVEASNDHGDELPNGYGHIPHTPQSSHASMPPVMRTQARRDVFWNNVVREILMSLASAAAAASGRLGTGPSDAQSSPSPVDDLFDGRMGVITTLGQRIPIADIIAVFACTMDGCSADRSRSSDVQCTVYRITTPTGESYTLPISQIIGVHSLSDALVDQLEEQANIEGEDDPQKIPFGFAAYTSLAQSEEDEMESGIESDSSAPESDQTRDN